MALTKTAVDMLGARVVEDGKPNPPGTVVIQPSTSSPRTARTGPLVDAGGQLLQSPEETAQPVKKGRRRKQQEVSKPAPRPLVKANIIANGMSIPTQYAYINKGTGVLVLWLTELSFIPQPAMKDAEGNITNKVKIDGYEGEWANLGQTFTDRDGTRCILLWQM